MKKPLIFFMIILLLFMTSCSKKQGNAETVSPADNEAAIIENKETIEDMDSTMNDIDSMLNDVSREDLSIDLR
ncbi:MAG: hypothetical protein LIR50_17160 [Bacillota bacterium]|nr:hypothetical protein [Bacillota bacterium]